MRRHKADKRDARSRGSGEIPNEHRKQSTSTTPERGATPQPSAPTPTPMPQLITGDRGRPQSHATANHNSNAASSSRKEITPRWFKPSETKLEAVKAAAARDVQLSRGASPAPSSPEDSALPHRRPRSKGFIPGADRGSNASQYDNVPGLEQDFEIVELDRPPSRMRQTPRSETPFSVSSLHQGSPSRGPSLAGSVVSVASGPRMAKHPLPASFPHNSPGGVHASYPLQQNSPGRTTTEVPIFHPAYSVSLDPRGEDRLYAPPARFTPPSSVVYGERAYATTQRPTTSPEKALMNNSYTTYRRGPARNARPLPEPLQLETPGSSTPIYLQQLTSTSNAQVYDYRFEGHRRNEANPHYLQEGGSRRPVDGLAWAPEDELPQQSPGGMPRSPSFQRAQMSPVQEFVFPPNPDGLLHYRTQFQEQQQPVIRQQLPQLFGGPHYRHAQEAFAMQESMLL